MLHACEYAELQAITAPQLCLCRRMPRGVRPPPAPSTPQSRDSGYKSSPAFISSTLDCNQQEIQSRADHQSLQTAVI
jgi:hypothetical protein